MHNAEHGGQYGAIFMDPRREVLEGAANALGGLDIMIKNAGGISAGRIRATSPSEIEAMLNVDLLAPILLSLTALPSLRSGSCPDQRSRCHRIVPVHRISATAS